MNRTLRIGETENAMYLSVSPPPLPEEVDKIVDPGDVIPKTKRSQGWGPLRAAVNVPSIENGVVQGLALVTANEEHVVLGRIGTEAFSKEVLETVATALGCTAIEHIAAPITSEANFVDAAVETLPIEPIAPRHSAA